MTGGSERLFPPRPWAPWAGAAPGKGCQEPPGRPQAERVLRIGVGRGRPSWAGASPSPPLLPPPRPARVLCRRRPSPAVTSQGARQDQAGHLLPDGPERSPPAERGGRLLPSQHGWVLRQPPDGREVSARGPGLAGAVCWTLSNPLPPIPPQACASSDRGHRGGALPVTRRTGPRERLCTTPSLPPRGPGGRRAGRTGRPSTRICSPRGTWVQGGRRCPSTLFTAPRSWAPRAQSRSVRRPRRPEPGRRPCMGLAAPLRSECRGPGVRALPKGVRRPRSPGSAGLSCG